MPSISPDTPSVWLIIFACTVYSLPAQSSLNTLLTKVSAGCHCMLAHSKQTLHQLRRRQRHARLEENTHYFGRKYPCINLYTYRYFLQHDQIEIHHCTQDNLAAAKRVTEPTRCRNDVDRKIVKKSFVRVDVERNLARRQHTNSAHTRPHYIKKPYEIFAGLLP